MANLTPSGWDTDDNITAGEQARWARDANGTICMVDPDNEQQAAYVAQLETDGMGNAIGLSGVKGLIYPTGLDQSSEISQYINDMASSGNPAEFSTGEYIIGTPMTLHSRKLLPSKYGTKGVGLTLRGAGAGETVFKDVSGGVSPTILIGADPAFGIGNRNYLTKLSGFSLIKCDTAGNPLPVQTLSGSAIEMRPIAAAGEVVHTTKLTDIYIDGYNYGVSLDDCTLVEFNNVWFCEFLQAIRLGYNADIVKIQNCMFGSEQFGSTYRNSAVGIQTGWNAGFNTPGASNCISISNTWFMKIGLAYLANDTNDRNVVFDSAYFEDCRQYYKAVSTASRTFYVNFDSCNFSHPTVNDSTDAKIQFTSTNTIHSLRIQDCSADSGTTSNAFVEIASNLGQIVWSKNRIGQSSFGQIRQTKSGVAGYRTLPNIQDTGGGTYIFGYGDGGLVRRGGDWIDYSVSPASGTTLTVDHLLGDRYAVTLPDGDITVTHAAYSPSGFSVGTRVRIQFTAPSTVSSTRTVTWGGAFRAISPTFSVTASDASKRRLFEFECINTSSNVWVQVNPDVGFN